MMIYRMKIPQTVTDRYTRTIISMPLALCETYRTFDKCYWIHHQPIYLHGFVIMRLRPLQNLQKWKL